MGSILIKKFIKKIKLLPEFKHAKILFSQTGEDAFLREIFLEKETGFYVDVGAHHPTRYSNTHIFYSMGWSGINIEPNIRGHKLFLEQRKRDINLNIGISKKEGTLTFYEMEPDMLSTFSKKEMESYLKEGYKLVKEIKGKNRATKAIAKLNKPKSFGPKYLATHIPTVNAKSNSKILSAVNQPIFFAIFCKTGRLVNFERIFFGTKELHLIDILYRLI